MDNHTIAFIICSNNDMLLNGCLLFINNLAVPNDITVQTIVVKEAASMTSGYNEAMNSSDAKYKVYLHQDVLITSELLPLIEVGASKGQKPLFKKFDI